MTLKIRIIIIGGIIIIGLVVLLVIATLGKSAKNVTNNTHVGSSVSPTSSPQTYEGNGTGSLVVQSPTQSVPTVPVVTVATDDNARNFELKYQLQTEPDLFVSNQLPYETNDFSASSTFTTNPVNHFYFIVVAKNGDTTIATQKFQQWLQSLGLSRQQLAQLDIRYQTQ